MNLPIWLYWEGDCPQWILECRKTVFAHADNVQLIDYAAFDKLRDCDRDIELSHLCTAHRADFIRAFLLAKFGGIWVDADCVVMRSLSPIFELTNQHDFIGYRERGGYVSNNFMCARVESKIACLYYKHICSILRSGKTLEWLTLGSTALTATIEESNIQWYEMSVQLIQPVCWSEPSAFFAIRNEEEHEKIFNKFSYCYMLSANMIGGYVNANSSNNLLDENSFFMFLLKKSNEEKINSMLMNIAHRKNTDDDRWVIPEVINNDMYQVKNVLAKMEPSQPSYVIDCGAHIGAFSIMCSLYFKNASIISFEPNPENFFYLNKNAENFCNITPMQKAVDVKDSTLNLYAPDQTDWSGRWSCLPNANKYITVEAINLFSFIKDLEKPVFILKLDLEGYEELIVNHATAEDLQNVQTIIVETHTETFNHEKLKELGFSLLFNPHISAARQFVYSKN